MAGQVLSREAGDGVGLVTLSNPGKRNALDPDLLGALQDALERLQRQGARAVVLTGEGEEIFSSGYDIGALPEAPDDAWLRDHGPLGPALRALARVPVVAALNGPAIGSGCELALTCDLRVAHEGVTLQMPPVRMGLIYTPEGVARLRALGGEGRARQMLLCGQAVPAPQALAWGLVNQVAPREGVLDAALELAGQMAGGAPLAVRGTKALMERLLQEEAALPGVTAAEVLAERRRAWYSADAREARAAFLQRRPPRFRGA